jgi:quercetin dioxygenase-like cupin family protein
MPGGVRTEIHLTGVDTGGTFCLIVDEPPPSWSLPPHLHRGVTETIHVIEGEFLMEVDGEESRLGPGETIHVPADAVHASASLGDRAGRRVLIFSPAGMESFFLEAGATSADEQVDPAAALAAAQRYGWEFVR